jgi:hypothetical protein
VNAIGILIADGPAPLLIWDTAPRSLRSEDLLLVLRDVPKRTGRLVAVLDNGSMHVSHVIKEALPKLKHEGIELYYLPTAHHEVTLLCQGLHRVRRAWW